MRLFIAIELSDELMKSLIGLMHEMNKTGIKGQYASADNLHLTLAFIGETDELSEIREAVGNIHVKPIKLSLSELGNFGDLIWIEVKGKQGLLELAKAVREALDSAGILYDRKGFLPQRVKSANKRVNLT